MVEASKLYDLCERGFISINRSRRFLPSSGDNYAKSIGGVEALIFAVEVTLLFTNFHRCRENREISILGRRSSLEKRRAVTALLLVHELFC